MDLPPMWQVRGTDPSGRPGQERTIVARTRAAAQAWCQEQGWTSAEVQPADTRRAAATPLSLADRLGTMSWTAWCGVVGCIPLVVCLPLALVFAAMLLVGPGGPEAASPFGGMVMIALLITGPLAGLAMALLPIAIAADRRHHNLLAISVLSLCLGWSLVGWTVAMVWALDRRA